MRTEEFRELLLAQRQRVLDRIGRVETNAREATESTAPDTARELEERAQADLVEHVMLQLDERSRAEMLAINAALDRIHRGEYGICEVCGRPIPEARLRAVPTATTHVEHAEGRDATRVDESDAPSPAT